MAQKELPITAIDGSNKMVTFNASTKSELSG